MKRICLFHLPTYLDALIHQRDSLPYCVTPSLKRLKVVLEFQPVIHRLRLSAWAQVPTYPEWTSLPQESLGFRWVRFSLTFRYSCQHSLFCTVHILSRWNFYPYRMLLYRCRKSLHSLNLDFSPIRAFQNPSFYSIIKAMKDFELRCPQLSFH